MVLVAILLAAVAELSSGYAATHAPQDVAAGSASRDLEAYLAVVEAYRRGDRDWAARVLLEWDKDDLRRAVARLTDRAAAPDGRRLAPGASRCRAPCAGAAILLHTELSVFFRKGAFGLGDGRSEDAGFHLALAETLARDLAGPELGTFERDWLLAVGWHLLDWARFSEAERWLRHALDASPRDAEVLLALASLYTAVAQGIVPIATGPPTRYTDLSRRDAHDSAQAALRRVLLRNPGDEEAHLRRGFLYRVTSQPGEARRELRWVVEHGRDPWLLYVAHLFLGGLEEERGRPAEAAAHYQAAVRIEPASQTARLALSHAMLLAGDVREAIAAGRAALDPGGGGAPVADGWNRWLNDAALRYEEILQRLRTEVAP